MTRKQLAFVLVVALLPGGYAIALESTPGNKAAAVKAAEIDPVLALRALQREHDALLAQQPALQEAAGQATALADQNQQLDQQVQSLQAQLDGLREEAARLRSDDRRRWFITGAAVLAAGMVLGLVLPMLRGRRRGGYGGFR